MNDAGHIAFQYPRDFTRQFDLRYQATRSHPPPQCSPVTKFIHEFSVRDTSSSLPNGVLSKCRANFSRALFRHGQQRHGDCEIIARQCVGDVRCVVRASSRCRKAFNFLADLPFLGNRQTIAFPFIVYQRTECSMVDGQTHPNDRVMSVLVLDGAARYSLLSRARLNISGWGGRSVPHYGYSTTRRLRRPWSRAD